MEKNDCFKDELLYLLDFNLDNCFA